ncbi:hypothetical protein L1987_38161 [Smallanthus sonchifolius]|uniref:Uncharacterized protein n=1 Tax=Smallanthus sonchifolius TaxID=185202 RepID=A0ACB9HJS0_9ASTR|nr:hypothetical protein L1987_38161 [Smallanthus sonchifolius]
MPPCCRRFTPFILKYQKIRVVTVHYKQSFTTQPQPFPLVFFHHLRHNSTTQKTPNSSSRLHFSNPSTTLLQFNSSSIQVVQ